MPFSFAKWQDTKRGSLLERNDGCAHPLQKGKKREPLLREYGSLESIKELYDLHARKDPSTMVIRGGTDKFTQQRTAARNSQFFNQVARDWIRSASCAMRKLYKYTADDANDSSCKNKPKLYKYISLYEISFSENSC